MIGEETKELKSERKGIQLRINSKDLNADWQDQSAMSPSVG